MTSRNAMLTVLVLVGIISWIDRQIFASLMEPLKLEFRFSDTQLGLLSGTAFGVVYAMAALPLAWLADTRSKKSILIVSVLGFSVATLLGGFALGFWTLFLARMLVGIGEAGASPASQALTAKAFPASERSFAMAVLFSYIPLGMMIGYFVGGWLSQYLGWRMVLVALGIPGILLALALKLLLEDSDTVTPLKREKINPWHQLRAILSIPGLVWLPIAGAIHGIGAWSIAVWLPSYYQRTFELSSGVVGTGFAIIYGFGGVSGILAGGWLADRYYRRGSLKNVLNIAIIATLLSAPLMILVFTADTFTSSLAALLLPLFLSHMFLGPVTGLVQSLAGVERGALGAAVYLVLSNFISMGLGPLITGFTSDTYSLLYGANSLRYSLLAIVPAAYAIASVCFFIAQKKVSGQSN